MTRKDWFILLGFAGFLLLPLGLKLLWPEEPMEVFLKRLNAQYIGACPVSPSPYGPISRSGDWRMHYGLDLASPKGTRVSAVSDGAVVFSGPCGGYGNVVILHHAGDVVTLYAHLAAPAPGLRPGVDVREGDLIGRVGPAAGIKESHLHFEVWEERAARQPGSGASARRSPVAGKGVN